MTAGVTIVIPTYGRPQQLPRCLAALPDVPVVVVDNNPTPSDDGFVHEPVQGASRARNRGADAAATDLIAFVDDDVEVGDGWLAAITAPFADPGVVAVVGPIELALDDRPRWLTPALEHWYSALDLGPVDRDLGTGEYGWSANLAVRRAALDAIGGYDTALGPGTPMGVGGDNDLLDRLRDAGGVVRYSADAGVRHRVDPDRLRLRWLAGRARTVGRAEVLLQGDGPRRVRAPRSIAGAARKSVALLAHRGTVGQQVTLWASHVGAAGAHLRPLHS
jgi:glycosyltransferase involved in cell wall biosynthesis